MPAGARYCVHCGAEQALPTPIAAVAAAIAQRGARPLPQAANAAHAEPSANEPRRAAVALPANDARSRRGPPKADAVASPRANDAHDTLPAYASTPRRAGVALALIIACFAVAVAALFAWRLLEPGIASRDASNDADDSIMSSFPPEATPARPNPAAASDASQSASPPLAAGATANTEREPTPPSRESTSAAGSASSGASSPATATPVEITPLPAKPVTRPSRRTAENETRTARAPLPPSPAAPAAPPARAPASTSPSTAVAAAPKAAASPSVDPLARLREELASCTREDFIARVVCGQRARWRHCPGYWGKVPECPGSPTPDHGQ